MCVECAQHLNLFDWFCGHICVRETFFTLNRIYIIMLILSVIINQQPMATVHQQKPHIHQQNNFFFFIFLILLLQGHWQLQLESIRCHPNPLIYYDIVRPRTWSDEFVRSTRYIFMSNTNTPKYIYTLHTLYMCTYTYSTLLLPIHIYGMYSVTLLRQIKQILNIQ